MSARKVLITGAAGEIGTFLVHHLAPQKYNLILADIRQPEYELRWPFINLDIADLDQFTAACKGIDTIVHLAGDRRTTAPWETLLPANVIGAYNVYEAARLNGCRRVIFASSNHAGSGYPWEVQVSPNMPPHPGNLYGATKAWAENVGQVFADKFDLSCLCLRIGWAGSRTDERKLNNPHGPAMYLTYEDATLLVSACIDAPDDLKFAIFNGISNNRHKKLDITNARELIGYEPQDDAFVLREHLLNM